MKKLQLLLATILAGSPASQALGEHTVLDYYSQQISWRTEGQPISSIHVALLPNGKLFFVGEDYEMAIHPLGSTFHPAFDPVVDVIRNFAPTEFPPEGVLVDGILHVDSLSCSGHAVLPDGRLFVAGGSLAGAIPEPLTYISLVGLPQSFIYDGEAGTWQLGAEMSGVGAGGLPGARWYPTVTRLSSGDMLVTAGFDDVEPILTPNLSVELYEPSTDTWSMVSEHAESPHDIASADYPHVVELPTPFNGTHELMVIGDGGVPAFMSMTASPKWLVSGQARPGNLPAETPNLGSSSTPLPMRLSDGEWGYGNGAVLYVGGHHETQQEQSIDVYDPNADSWGSHIDMGFRRHHPSTVLLPDGRILILAGHDDSSSENLPGYAHYVDPRDGFSLHRGSAKIPEKRGYHTVTALLPDGRVLVGGGNEGGEAGGEQPNFRYYFPDYIFRWPRPIVFAASETVQLGQAFWMLIDGQTNLTEVVAMGLPAQTHSYDMNQRNVQLQVLGVFPFLGLQIALVQTPVNPVLTPPGHYMIFALNESFDPSLTSRMVQFLP